MRPKMSFAEADRLDHRSPGIYEIHTRSGIPLKVGIAVDLRNRLRQHRASRQGALKLKPGGDWSNPNDVLSKQSILAKHLYYDREIAPDYDLTTEVGRRQFLEQQCALVVEVTDSRASARELERLREADGGFRYVGRVSVRP